MTTDAVVPPPLADSAIVAVNREFVEQCEKLIVILTGIELAGARFPNCTGKACADPPLTLAVSITGCEVQAGPLVCLSVKLVISAAFAAPGPLLLIV